MEPLEKQNIGNTYGRYGQSVAYAPFCRGCDEISRGHAMLNSAKIVSEGSGRKAGSKGTFMARTHNFEIH